MEEKKREREGDLATGGRREDRGGEDGDRRPCAWLTLDFIRRSHFPGSEV